MSQKLNYIVLLLKTPCHGHGCINIMEQVITIKGLVKEVRPFLSFVTLFIKVNTGEYCGKVIKLTLSNDNCQRLLTWAQLEEGAEISVKRTQGAGIPRNRTYSLEILKSQVIDMDEI